MDRRSRAPIACALAAACGGCNLVFDAESDDPGGAFARTIAITPDAVLTTPIPISLRIDADPALVAHARADGADLHVTLGGTILPFELVAFDPNGALDAWFELPRLEGPVDVELRYGSRLPIASPPMWSGHRAVWHLGDPDALGRDSSPRRLDLTTNRSNVPDVVDGVAGGALAFDGMDQLCTAEVVNLDAQSFTVVAWVDAQPQDDADLPLDSGGRDTSGFSLELGTGAWRATVLDDAGNPAEVQLAAEAPAGWTQLALVFDRDAHVIRGHRDGNQGPSVKVQTFGGVGGIEPLCLSGEIPYVGLLDEVRILERALSTEHLHLEYRNLAHRKDFMTIGDEVAAP